jgi:hypothetical protein
LLGLLLREMGDEGRVCGGRVAVVVVVVLMGWGVGGFGWVARGVLRLCWARVGLGWR